MIAGKEQIKLQKLRNLINLLFNLGFDFDIELKTAIVLNFSVSALSMCNSRTYIQIF